MTTNVRSIKTRSGIIFKININDTKDWQIWNTLKTSKTISVNLTKGEVHDWQQLLQAIKNNDYSLSVSYERIKSILRILEPNPGYCSWMGCTYLIGTEKLPIRRKYYADVGRNIRMNNIRLPYNDIPIKLIGTNVPPLYGNFALYKDPIYDSNLSVDNRQMIENNVNLTYLTGIMHCAYIKAIRIPGYSEEFPELPRKVVNWSDIVDLVTYPRFILENYDLTADELVTDMMAIEKYSDVQASIQYGPHFSDFALAGQGVKIKESFEGIESRITQLIYRRNSWSSTIPRTMVTGILLIASEMDIINRYPNVDNVTELYITFFDAIVNSSIKNVDDIIIILGFDHLVEENYSISLPTVNMIISPGRLVNSISSTYIRGSTLENAVKNGMDMLGVDLMSDVVMFLSNFILKYDYANNDKLLEIAEEIYNNL